MEPKTLAVARCGMGYVGLITSSTPVLVAYGDGSNGLAWTGIHLEAHPPHNNQPAIAVGDPWSSRHPVVYAYLDQHLADFIFDK